MNLRNAKEIADGIVEKMRPHCERIEIAGSIRRQCPEPGDIEIVYVPKVNGRNVSALFDIISRMIKVKGDPMGKYTQRLHPGHTDKEQIKVDFFSADRNNWGLQLAIRTGSAKFSHLKLAVGWSRLAYRSKGGVLYSLVDGKPVYIREEQELFDLLGIPWIEPKLRNL